MTTITTASYTDHDGIRHCQLLVNGQNATPAIRCDDAAAMASLTAKRGLLERQCKRPYRFGTFDGDSGVFDCGAWIE